MGFACKPFRQFHGAVPGTAVTDHGFHVDLCLGCQGAKQHRQGGGLVQHRDDDGEFKVQARHVVFSVTLWMWKKLHMQGLRVARNEV